MEFKDRTVTIKGGVSGVISTGSFENERCMPSIEETYNSFIGTDEEIQARQKQLNDMCYSLFEQQAEISAAKRIQKEREDIRFYDCEGHRYASVTSIIGWDEDYYVLPTDLVQYAAQGNINHLKLHYYIKTKQWLKAEKIPEAYKDIVIVKKGGLGLQVESGNLPAFIEKYPINFTKSEQTVFSHDHKYAGTLDALGYISRNKEWEKLGVKFDVLTIFDLKRHKDNIKNMKQMSAYAKACGGDIKQMVTIIVNDDTKQGYSKPSVSCNIDDYFKMFLEDRKLFRERYGI